MKNIELRRKARLLVFIVTLMAATFCDFVSANDFVANQIIVRVDDVLTLQDAASVVDNGDFTVIRELDGELGYFLVSVHSPVLSENDAIAELLAIPEVSSAFLNTLGLDHCSGGVVPDDPDWPNQWTLSDGVRACDAWDITSGGIDLDGTPICVAVIDYGICSDCIEYNTSGALEYEPNLWTNQAELSGVPGVDDDGNGKVDDFYGWDAVNNDNSVGQDFFAAHAEWVASIVGAVSNNQMCSGINKRIRMINVQAGYREPNNQGVFRLSDCIAAMSYVRETKRVWNESDGQVGANIVVMNCSWGFNETASSDAGQALNNEIEAASWEGILTTSGTTNTFADVDDTDPLTATDVPSTCSSEYLLTVTATNSFDNPDLLGYGTTSIDMAAPGSINGLPIIISAPDWWPFRPFVMQASTTSIASGHVAGSIALLYSVPNPAWQWHLRASAREQSTLLRNTLIETGDHFTNLEWATQSGNRVNLSNAVRLACQDQTQEPTADMVVDSWETLYPSSSSNYDREGEFEFVTYADGSSAYYGWRSTGQENWTMYRLTSPIVNGTVPSLAVGTDTYGTETMTRCHISWLGGPQKINILQHSLSSDATPIHEWRIVTRLEDDIWGPFRDPNAILTNPVICAQSQSSTGYPTPVIFVGVQNTDHPGIHYWTAKAHRNSNENHTWYDSEKWNWSFPILAPGEDYSFVAFTAYQEDRAQNDASSRVYLSWINDDGDIYLRYGDENQAGEISWNYGYLGVVAENVNVPSSDPTLTMTYSQELQTMFIAWEEAIPGRTTRRIAIAKGWDTGSGIDFSLDQPEYIEMIGRDYRNPMLRSYSDGPTQGIQNISRVALSFDWVQHSGLRNPPHEQLNNPIIGVTGLRINEAAPLNRSQWEWLPVTIAGFGRGASLANAQNGIYRLAAPTLQSWIGGGEPTDMPIVTHDVYLNYGETPIESVTPITIQSEVYVEPPFALAAPLVVESGGCLRIGHSESGQNEIAFMNNAGIQANSGAVLIISGEGTQSISMRPYLPTTTWSGISLVGSESDENTLSHCSIEGAGLGIVVQSSELNVESSSVTGCNIGTAWINSSGEISNSSFTDNSRFGMYGIGSDISLSGASFERNDLGGIRLWRSEHAQLSDCNISGNGIGSSGYRSGVQLLGGSARFSCSKVADNGGPGIMLFSQSFGDLNGVLGTGAWNEMQNNMTELSALNYDYGQISLVGGIFDAFCGFNTIEESTNSLWLVRSQYENLPAPGWDVGLNYWGTTNEANIQSRLPVGTDISSYLTFPESCQGATCLVGPGTENEEELFRSGWAQEREAQFTTAIQTYELLLTLYPSGTFAGIALQRIDFCKKAQGYSSSDVRDYFLDLAADSSKDPSVVFLARSNAAWCLVEMGDFQDAFAEMTALLDQNSPDYATLKVELDLLLLELEQDQYNLLLAAEGGPRSAGALDSYEGQSRDRMEHLFSQVDELLGIHEENSNKQITTQGVLPTNYALLQNHPNPFNSVTEIEFDIPEDISVDLSIYNTLGQKVVNLTNARMRAGHHIVSWNGKSNAGIDVATGLYIYQLKAGSFLDTKKMILMR